MYNFVGFYPLETAHQYLMIKNCNSKNLQKDYSACH